MRYIELSQGQRAAVDDDLYEWLNQWKWYARWDSHTNGFYAVRAIRLDGRRTTLQMHRVIIGCVGKQRCDHIDHNTLNNQRHNLRAVSNTENAYNRKPKRGCTSPHKGVYWDRQHGKWRVTITANGHREHLGYYTNEDVAAGVYAIRAHDVFGEFAYIDSQGA